MTNARALLEDFHRQHLDKPGAQSKTTRDTRRFKGGIECHDMARLEPMMLCYMSRALDH